MGMRRSSVKCHSLVLRLCSNLEKKDLNLADSVRYITMSVERCTEIIRCAKRSAIDWNAEKSISSPERNAKMGKMLVSG